ncbi:MAG: response regulator [Thermodesulfovibrionales bacterium]|jgi:signal transduction histidine kinase
MTRQNLRVFFLEDNPDDVELEIHELTNGGFEVTRDLARNRDEFLEKLPGLDVDIILADFALPDITGIEAIQICRDRKIDVPIIFITGAGDERIAVDSLREGAIDYILKKNISGLSARVSRALDIWAERRAKERAESEKKKFQELLFQAQKMESVGTLASGVAHDFNNIMTGILGYTEMIIEETPEDSPHYEKMQIISSLCQRAASVTHQLLIFGRKMPVELRRININSFIKETMNILKPAIGEGIEIRLVLQDDMPDIKADAGQLTQIFMNLALNARDAMNNTGLIEFRAERCSAREIDGRSGKYICISVSDTGCGIPESDIRNIFDPFFTTKGVGKGTGLGLAIVYSIVYAHSGWIEVSSKPSEGTTFRICFPSLSEDAMVQMSSSDASYDRGMNMSRNKEVILFAEDEAMIRDVISSALGSYGYDVLLARDGEEAIEIYKSRPDEIDIVISDKTMPRKSGIELFNELKSLDPEIKFILMTGYGLSEKDHDVCRDMERVITKPCPTSKIAHFVKKALQS